jgi:hypothetical protein
MLFGHAPIVFPAILGKALPFRSTFYVHLALLHASVALRLTGDVVEVLGQYRAWGGLLNALALDTHARRRTSSRVRYRPASRHLQEDRCHSEIHHQGEEVSEC